METSFTEEEISQVLGETKRNPFQTTVPLLTNGVLKNLEPPLLRVATQLNELRNKQHHLIDEIHTENLALSEIQHSHELEEMFVKIKLYLTKLQNSKKDLRLLHDKSTKLKKRALKLQQIIEKQEYTKNALVSKTEASSSTMQ